MPLTVLVAFGLMLLWLGERVVEGGTARVVSSGLGLGLVVVAVLLRVTTMRRASGLAAVHRTFLALHLGTVGALLLYALQSDLFTKVTGESLATNSSIVSGALSALWPAALVVSLVPAVLMEISFASMSRAAKVEDQRLSEALFSGVGVACALIFAFSLQYVLTERDVKADFSYFRVARPGEATKKLVASLDEPLEVYLFFPPASDAATAVEQYFDELKIESPQLAVSRLDHALEPARAKELGVSGNGNVLFKKGARKETLFIGNELEKARTQLRGLDAEVQKRVLQVGKSKRTVYLTQGHGERTVEPAGANDQRSTIEILNRALKDQNFEVRPLTTAEGLAQEIPSDATAVFVLGPTSPFLAPEAAALEAYEKRGGRVFIALDAESALPFTELMQPLGLSFRPQQLAQEKNTATVRPPPGPADRINIGTRSYSSHPSVTNLGRSQSALLMLGAGGLEELPQHPADLSVDFAVRSGVETWNDANANFELDPAAGEAKKAWGLALAVERKAKSKEESMRALVLADSDAVADLVLQQLPGNQLLVVDGFRWLLGDEQLSGTTNTEVDVPLSRNRQQDSLWFYGTTFFAPVLVLAVGFLARRRAKRSTLEEARS